MAAGLGTGFEEELREFLEAGSIEGGVDPLFRERLRRRLWAMLMRQVGRDEPGSRGPVD